MPNQVASASLVANSSIGATPAAQYDLGAYGADPYGFSSYGSVLPPFGVISASSLSPYMVEVSFNAILDFTYSPMLDPTNYVIPGLTVSVVTPQSAGSVVLTTSPQIAIEYIVTVGSAKSVFGQVLDVNMRTATFEGELVSPTMRAVAVSPTKVRLLFDVYMLNDLNLSSLSSYSVKDTAGNHLTIDSVIVEQLSDILSVALVLDATTPFRTQNTYQATISNAVHTIYGQAINPATVPFYWVDEWVQPFDRPGLLDSLPLVIPFKVFTGEVSGGLLGDPDGQVFFSPALDAPTSGSVIQVDEVDVCTYAYDSYHIPQPIDPNSLYTFTGVYQPPGNVLGPFGAVLWAPFPRNFEAQIVLEPSSVYPIVPFQDDFIPPPMDTGCSVSLNQQWNSLYVALLNNPGWVMFKRNGVIVGNSNISAAPMTRLQVHSSVIAESFASATPFENQHGRASIVSDSHLFFGQRGSADLVANSDLSVVGGVPQKVHSSVIAESYVKAEENQPFPVSPMIFICANNLSPLPPPIGMQVLILKEQLISNSMTVGTPS